MKWNFKAKILLTLIKMAMNELSFAPDRRSVQGLTFHFSERPSNESGNRGFSQQDSLTFALSKIYESKFPRINPQLRNTLIDILVTSVPLAHRNLTMLAAANYIVYDMRNRYPINEITPELYSAYFNNVASDLLNDVTRKTPEDAQTTWAKFKITLLRYVFYVLENIPKIATINSSPTIIQ